MCIGIIVRHRADYSPSRLRETLRLLGLPLLGLPLLGVRSAVTWMMAGPSRSRGFAAIEDIRNACSKLYAAAWRTARAMGYLRAITYTLQEEPGTSVKAAGWKCVGKTRDGNSWNRSSRPRIDKHPLQAKLKWEMGL